MAKKAAKKAPAKKAPAKKAPAKKAPAKKAAAKSAPTREVLVVASKVKAYIKSKNMMCSSESIQAISEKIYCMLDAACARTEANRRSTVKPQDL